MKEELLKKISTVTAEQALVGKQENRTVTIRQKRISRLIGMEPEASVCVGVHSQTPFFPKHGHDYIEMMYVCKGRISHTVGSDTLDLREGDLLLLGKKTEHSIETSSMSDIGINFMMSADFFESMLSELKESSRVPNRIFEDMLHCDGDLYAVFRTAGNLKIENLMENIVCLLVEGTEPDRFILQRSLELLFAYLESVPHSFSNLRTDSLREEKLMHTLLEYIETSYRTATLEKAAELLRFSPAYLSRWIHSHMGKTFKELLADRRFAVAKELLLTTDATVDSIIEHIGYDNKSYFHRQFRSRYGETPRKFRILHCQ